MLIYQVKDTQEIPSNIVISKEDEVTSVIELKKRLNDYWDSVEGECCLSYRLLNLNDNKKVVSTCDWIFIESISNIKELKI